MKNVRIYLKVPAESKWKKVTPDGITVKKTRKTKGNKTRDIVIGIDPDIIPSSLATAWIIKTFSEIKDTEFCHDAKYTSISNSDSAANMKLQIDEQIFNNADNNQ